MSALTILMLNTAILTAFLVSLKSTLIDKVVLQFKLQPARAVFEETQSELKKFLD
jgi:hypothetical protein